MGSIERYLDLRVGILCVVNTSSDFVTHSHDEPTLTFSLGGNPGTVSSEGDTLPLRSDLGLALNAQRQHSHSLGGIAGRFLCMKVDPELNRARWPESRGGRLLFGRVALPVDRNVAKLLATLSAPKLAIGDAEDCGAALLDWAVMTSGGKVASTARPGASDYRVRRAMSYMAENASRPHDIHAAAAAAGLSRARFCELFRVQVGATPTVFWNMLRTAEVVDELSSGPSSLKRLAQRLGFASAVNFSRFFRDRTGVSPSTFRAATRLSLRAAIGAAGVAEPREIVKRSYVPSSGSDG